MGHYCPGTFGTARAFEACKRKALPPRQGNRCQSSLSRRRAGRLLHLVVSTLCRPRGPSLPRHRSGSHFPKFLSSRTQTTRSYNAPGRKNPSDGKKSLGGWGESERERGRERGGEKPIVIDRIKLDAKRQSAPLLDIAATCMVCTRSTTT
jgi:hypothetical protein